MHVIGLTGSIGMGKSTVAAMFGELGVPVASSDEIVHDLYAGSAAPMIENAFPGTTTPEGVDRQKLSSAVLGQPEAMKKLEALIHPLVRQAQLSFLKEAKAAGHQLALLDIPLLFESGSSLDLVDRTVVVSCSAVEQRCRVLARPYMTAEKFQHILSRQMPDSEKRRRADDVIETDGSLSDTRQQVQDLVAALLSEIQQDGHGEI